MVETRLQELRPDQPLPAAGHLHPSLMTRGLPATGLPRDSFLTPQHLRQGQLAAQPQGWEAGKQSLLPAAAAVRAPPLKPHGAGWGARAAWGQQSTNPARPHLACCALSPTAFSPQILAAEPSLAAGLSALNARMRVQADGSIPVSPPDAAPVLLCSGSFALKLPFVSPPRRRACFVLPAQPWSVYKPPSPFPAAVQLH